MCYPPSRNGNMPAGQVRRRCIRGEMTLIHRVPIITGMVLIRVSILSRLVMWVNTRPTRGAFSICMEMCGSGPRTGTRRLIPPATRWWILADRHRARIGSGGVVPGAASGRPCVLLSATATPPATGTTTSASVLVSNSSSKGREEA